MDWIGVALSIGGMYLLPKHYHYAIGLFIVSNFVWDRLRDWRRHLEHRRLAVRFLLPEC